MFFDSCWKGFNLNESYCSKRVQFCESCLKRVQICKKMWKSEKINSWSPFVKRVQFFESHSKKCSVFLWVISEKFQTFGSYFIKEKVHFFESVGETRGSILWVMLKSVRFLWVISEKFTPLYHITKIQSFLWVKSEKIQSCGSYFQKRSSILWVTLEKINSLSHLKKKMFSFYESFGGKDIQFCESYSKKILWVIFGEKMRCSILRVIFEKKMFNSVRHIRRKEMFNSVRHIREKRCSIFCVILKKAVQCFESISILWVILKKIQFFESHSKKSILGLTFCRKLQFFESHSKKKVISKNVQILRVWKGSKRVEFSVIFVKRSIQ